MSDKKDNQKKKKSSFPYEFLNRLNSSRKNPWMIATIVLGIILIILSISSLGNQNISSSVASESKVSENINSFLESQSPEGQGDAKIINIEKESGLYKITISYRGQELPLYTTLDGENLVQGVTPLQSANEQENTNNPQNPQEDIPKSEKPVLEAFVSPYCPYGLQYLKGLMPVYDLLEGKAEINVQYMGITHMQEEKPETKTRLCILEEYGKEKSYEYAKEIIYDETAQACYNIYHGVNLQTNEQINSENARSADYFNDCMEPIINSAMDKLNIDSEKIGNCINEKGDELYNDATQYAGSQGVGGSPTPIINGVQVPNNLRGRSPEAIKTAVCSAFAEGSKPEECSQTLQKESPSPGISPLSSTSSGTQTQGAC